MNTTSCDFLLVFSIVVVCVCFEKDVEEMGQVARNLPPARTAFNSVTVRLQDRLANWPELPRQKTSSEIVFLDFVYIFESTS